MRMRYRVYISIFLIILHLLSLVQYYSFDVFWVLTHVKYASILFYGIPFVSIGLNMVLITTWHKPSLIEKEIVRIHSYFTLLIGIICLAHYSGIMVISQYNKLLFMYFAVLVIFVIMLWSAYTHGLFKKK